MFFGWVGDHRVKRIVRSQPLKFCIEYTRLDMPIRRRESEVMNGGWGRVLEAIVEHLAENWSCQGGSALNMGA